MKAFLSVLFVATLLQSASAFAFVTKISVVDPFKVSETQTVLTASDTSLYEMDRKILTYRGRPEEARSLVEQIVKNMGAKPAEKLVELNEGTGTITVRFQAADSFVPVLIQLVITRDGN